MVDNARTYREMKSPAIFQAEFKISDTKFHNCAHEVNPKVTRVRKSGRLAQPASWGPPVISGKRVSQDTGDPKKSMKYVEGETPRHPATGGFIENMYVKHGCNGILTNELGNEIRKILTRDEHMVRLGRRHLPSSSEGYTVLSMSQSRSPRLGV